MTIELLYLEGCPHLVATVDLVHSVMKSEGMAGIVQQIRIGNSEDAKAHDFPGSPTVRVNGRDIEKLPSLRLPAGFACRTYVVEGKAQGVPPRSLLEQAIRAARMLEDRR
jgi:hypothetical protein